MKSARLAKESLVSVHGPSLGGGSGAEHATRVKLSRLSRLSNRHLGVPTSISETSSIFSMLKIKFGSTCGQSSVMDPSFKSSLHTRSELRIQDEGAKYGTEVDGAQVAPGSSTLLNKDQHTFRLGKTLHIFRIKWQPVVLSVSFGAKETKAGKDPLAPLQNRLEHTDIKIIGPYIIGKTTHVIQGKRNTAKGLQALINGKYIVNESYADALVYATAPTDFDHDESLTPLEEDFKQHWPDPMQHVPPKGKEPNERPVESFAPNPGRANVFEGYTFVLCEKAQFESLQGPITNGGGKAMMFGLKSRQTTTEELVGYVKGVAGEKGLGELEDGSEGKGVVVVKFRGGKDDFEWAAELVRTASLALDLRFIEQNEFMDAILLNDASVLRRPLEVARDDDPAESNGTLPTIQNGAAAIQESRPEPEISQPPAQRRPRGLIKSRFKGFSEDSDEDIKPHPLSKPPERSQMHAETQPSDPTPSNPRKRPVPATEEANNGEDLADQLFPAATAMKRRKLQETEAARLRGESPPATVIADSKNPEPKAKKQPELDIKKSLRQRREAADQAAARDHESLQHEHLTPAAIEAMRDLAVVEEFEIVPHSPHRRNGTAADANGNDNGRWNPTWNGRKNFKKFRRQGDGVARRGGGGQGVIVPLEEVPNKGFGIGEGYWLDESGGGGREEKAKTKRKRTMRSQDDESLEFGGGKGSLKVEDDGMDDDVVDVEAPKRTTRTQTQTQTQTQNPLTVGRKAQAQMKIADDESDSEDELKFRFGKRRRMG
ncbi:MAG: hypothetical protein Q9223_007196 [Gallowayella weberi]